MTRRFSAGIVVAFALIFAGAAGADEPTVVDQYTEQVPTPGGERPTGSVKPPEQIGDGEASPAAGAAEPASGGSSSSSDSATSGGVAAGGTGSGGGGQATGGSAGEPTACSSVPSTEGSTVESIPDSESDGMGALFPILLIGAALVAAAAFFMRRSASRSRTS